RARGAAESDRSVAKGRLDSPPLAHIIAPDKPLGVASDQEAGVRFNVFVLPPPPYRVFCACAIGTAGTSCMRRPRARARRSRQRQGGGRSPPGEDGGGDGDGPPSRPRIDAGGVS